MKTKLLMTVSVVSLMSQVALANQAERFDKAYKDHAQVAQVVCAYPGVRTLSTEVIKEKSFTSTLSLDEETFKIKVFINDGLVKAQLVYRDNIIPGSMFRNKSLAFSDNMESNLEVSKLGCAIKTFYDKPIILSQEKIHINVHPHTNYDRYGMTTDKVNEYLLDTSYQNIVLLDAKDNTESINVFKFIEDSNAALRGIKRSSWPKPVVTIPESVPMSVAPIGKSIFNIELDKLDVTYTGGNINLCVNNSTRSLIRDFVIQNKNGGELVINYDLDAMVAQNKTVKLNYRRLTGWRNPYGFKSFVNGEKQLNSIFVKDHFNKNPRFEKKYHQYIYDLIIADIKSVFNDIQKTNFFDEINFSYTQKENTKSETIKGSGFGKYKIQINHINE